MANPLSLPPPKPVRWVGTSKDDVSGFPKEVRQRVGGALWEAQIGRKASYARPLKGFRPTDRERRARIIGEWLTTETRYLAS